MLESGAKMHFILQDNEIGVRHHYRVVDDFVRGDVRDAEAIAGRVAQIRAEIDELASLGIEVADVQLKRLNFPEQNKQSVFARMRAGEFADGAHATVRLGHETMLEHPDEMPRQPYGYAHWTADRGLVWNSDLVETLELDNLLPQAERLESEGKTAMFVGQGKRIIGIIAVADALKPTSAQAVRGWSAP